MSETRKKFLTSIVHAGGAAAVGNKKEMESFIKEAKEHHRVHIADYSTKSSKAETDAEHTRCNNYYDKVRSIFDGSFRPIKKSESNKPSLLKAVGPSQLPERTTVRKVGIEDHTNKVAYKTNPQASSKHDYTHYDQLSSEQQHQAHKMFSGRDMNQYHYAVGKDGDVSSVPRTKNPPRASNQDTYQTNKFNSGEPSNAPAANEPFIKDHGTNPKTQPSPGEVLPHHVAGSNIRIESKDHEDHGRIGKVLPPSPYHPGKVPVEIMKRAGQVGTSRKTIYVEPKEAHPYQMRPLRPSNETQKSEDNVVNLAKVALERLKKRG